jgi:DNA-binding beta-propeller fold protein YncE
VTKIKAGDGSITGTYTVQDNPAEFAFDGQNVWVTNYGAHTVSKLRGSDGSVVGTYPVGKFPRSIAFDKTNIWVD